MKFSYLNTTVLKYTKRFQAGRGDQGKRQTSDTLTAVLPGGSCIKKKTQLQIQVTLTSHSTLNNFRHDHCQYSHVNYFTKNFLFISVSENIHCFCPLRFFCLFYTVPLPHHLHSSGHSYLVLNNKLLFIYWNSTICIVQVLLFLPFAL